MSQIECYEPEFVRQYLKKHPQPVRSPLSISWQHESRRSLLLDDYDCCDAVLGSPEAFALNVKMIEADPATSPLSPVMGALNQAALDVVTLPGLSIDLRLYALGVMLSFVQKLPGDRPDLLRIIASLPAQMAHYAAEGTLTRLYQQLPPLNTLSRPLISQLGRLSLDWDKLTDCTRKFSLPLQISLLGLQDKNSEALMQQQLAEVWETQGQATFADRPWIWTNYLVYRLYHDTFPQHDTLSVTACYLQLVSDIFLLRSLFSLWLMDDSTLTHEQIISLFCVFESWRHAPACATERAALRQLTQEDELLSAFSLLIR